MGPKEWFERARKEGFTIGAFNVGNLETFRAIAEAAAELRSPILVESSPGETKWMGEENMVDIARNFSEKFGIPIFVNLDHAESLEDCLAGIEAGYDLVHFDGSGLPYEENLKITKKVVEEAHSRGLLVEGEIDRMARKSSEVYREDIALEELKKTFSNPERVRGFVKETGIDIMAILFGNIHGVFPTQPPLDFELLTRIRAAVPDTFFSLHGGSGIPENEIKKAIQVGGVVKININTEMRRAFRETLEKALKEHPDEMAMYKVMPSVLEAVKEVVRKKIKTFGSAGKI